MGIRSPNSPSRSLARSASTRSRFPTSLRSCSALKKLARPTPPDGSDRASNWCSTPRSHQGLRTATLINPAGSNLIAAAHPSKRKGERRHYRAVKIDDAQEVFRALKAEEGSAFGAWLFMVLTAARPSEALEARWAEVDFDRRLWTLPAERMKSAKQHVVPLSIAALAVLDRQQRVRTGDAMFPGGSGSPLSYASFATAPAKAGINACTPHGWRSCFRDWCGDIGDVPRDLAEAALAHSLNATEGAYRRMTAVERRREVMTRYADWLNDERGKVLAFPIGKPV